MLVLCDCWFFVVLRRTGFILHSIVRPHREKASQSVVTECLVLFFQTDSNLLDRISHSDAC